jgi:hypothetical protein
MILTPLQGQFQLPHPSTSPFLQEEDDAVTDIPGKMRPVSSLVKGLPTRYILAYTSALILDGKAISVHQADIA